MLKKSTAVTPIVVSERDAATMIGLSPSALRRKRNDGKGPRAIWLSGRRLGYRVTELEAWIDSRPTA